MLMIRHMPIYPACPGHHTCPRPGIGKRQNEFAIGHQPVLDAFQQGLRLRHMLNHLIESDVCVEGKSFAMGLRIEHTQKEINEIQYRQFANHPKLGSANYKLAHHDDGTGIGVYSFCSLP